MVSFKLLEGPQAKVVTNKKNCNELATRRQLIFTSLAARYTPIGDARITSVNLGKPVVWFTVCHSIVPPCSDTFNLTGRLPRRLTLPYIYLYFPSGLLPDLTLLSSGFASRPEK